MSEDIELQNMTTVSQARERNSERNGTPPDKTGLCSSTILRYRCAVVCLVVLCALLAVVIGLVWPKTTSEAECNCHQEMPQRTSMDNGLETRMEIMQYAVDVTLDPETAHDYLILSADGKRVKHGDTSQNRPDNPKRFDQVVSVLGKGFTMSKRYYEVQVSRKTSWVLGVGRQSINRKGQIVLTPTNGYWAMWLMNNQYKALDDPPVTLSLKEKPERVGVFVDYGAGLVSFYDADRWSLIYSYKGVIFKEIIYPYFSPGTNDKGKNSAPLVIAPFYDMGH